MEQISALDNFETSPSKKFQILSLDGGGIKGLFSAAFLAAIENDLKINIVDRFDLIAGTSTGGIIALALGLGMRPREIVEFYIKEKNKIFPSFFGLKFLQHAITRKYSSKNLETALKNYFKSSKLADSKKRLVITSYNLGEDDVYLFRTPHHERLTRDYKVDIWKIAMATSAAPTYFSCCRHIDKLRLIDGGVWANNPLMTAIIEAQGTLNIPLKSISALSIGTSNAVIYRNKWLNFGGKLLWAPSIADLFMRGQNLSCINQARFLIGDNNLMRVDPDVPGGVFELDKTDNANSLIAKASHFSRKLMPLLKVNFTSHIASKFENSEVINAN